MESWLDGKEPLFFGIDQSESGTAVEEITEEEYAKRHAVLVMTNSLERRRSRFSYFDGNAVERIMEQFIRDRIYVGDVDKIVVSNKLLPHFVLCAGFEVHTDMKNGPQCRIFDDIVPIEFSDELIDYEICMKGC